MTDSERHKDRAAAKATVFENYGAKLLVRGGANEVKLGELPLDRHVVHAFES